jgi:hypothetical protein
LQKENITQKQLGIWLIRKFILKKLTDNDAHLMHYDIITL